MQLISRIQTDTNIFKTTQHENSQIHPSIFNTSCVNGSKFVTTETLQPRGQIACSKFYIRVCVCVECSFKGI